MILRLLTPSPVVPNISQRMTLHTTIPVVLREDAIKDRPNQRTFQHFFGGGPLKWLENMPNAKPRKKQRKSMMQPLPKNVNTTGLLIVLPLQLYQNPKIMSNLPTISFPQCQSSPIRGARMVETIATEINFRISQSSCAFTFPTRSWQDPLDRRRSTTLLPPKLHPIRNGS